VLPSFVMLSVIVLSEAVASILMQRLVILVMLTFVLFWC
jgi:hypothetical protein